MFDAPLFENQNVHLSAYDPEKDAGVVSAWSARLRFARLICEGSPHPLTPMEVNRLFEPQIKPVEGSPGQRLFAVRRNDTSDIVGLVRLPELSWSNRTVEMQLLFSAAETQSRFAVECLELSLNYVFRELNLECALIKLPEDEVDLAKSIESLGFRRQVCRRQALFHDGRRWDEHYYVLQAAVWLQRKQEPAR